MKPGGGCCARHVACECDRRGEARQRLISSANKLICRSWWRDDTAGFLREKDMKEGGSDERFYVFDETSKLLKRAANDQPQARPVRSRVSEENFRGTDAPGQGQKVRPSIRDSQGEATEGLFAGAGVENHRHQSGLIRGLARDIAKAKTVANVTSSNWGKFYHGSLIERSQILVLALCGHMGKKGSGFSAFPFLCNDGFDRFVGMPASGVSGAVFMGKMIAKAANLEMHGYTDEMVTMSSRAKPRRQGRLRRAHFSGRSTVALTSSRRVRVTGTHI